MEPMNLGSAPSSPSTPGVHPNFLPSFLMGEPSQPSTPTTGGTSPGRPGRSARPPVCHPRAAPFNQSVGESPILATKQPFIPHKPGPPSQGLFDAFDHSRKPGSPILSSTVMDSPGLFGRSMPRMNESISRVNNNEDCSFNCTPRTFNESINSPATSRFDRIDTHWVTVFGFPPSALSLVLAQLSNCGVIVEKKVPNQGNWVHVKFNSLSDVPRALALNGRCLNNSFMIGVRLFHDKENNKENDNNGASFSSSMKARSLRQSFVSPNSSHSVLPPPNVPQKSTGMVSKAIEYVFGW